MIAAPSISVLSFLLNAGAPINGTTVRGDTCLHYAVMAGHEEAVRFLLQSVRLHLLYPSTFPPFPPSSPLACARKDLLLPRDASVTPPRIAGCRRERKR